jgi:BirA family biotin operon repressor/biotin-[acetyl-CoA-carboxylase] ligase
MNALEPRSSQLDGWTFWELDSVASTNLFAARLPAWSAVRADTQSAGRGRFDRKWVSDRGGLWLSAVVPTRAASLRFLPLLAGLAVCDVARQLGADHVRLRWPNDVMVLDRKLAGVLIDHFKPGLAVIGIGLNVSNHPAIEDASLKNQAVRLADILPSPVACEALTTPLLGRLRALVESWNLGETGLLLSRVNALWDRPRRVELELNGVSRAGWFAGVDEDGKLLLSDDLGVSASYNPEQVLQLIETHE